MNETCDNGVDLAPAMGVYTAFLVVSFAYALWTLKADIEIFYGWQNGGWKGKWLRCDGLERDSQTWM